MNNKKRWFQKWFKSKEEKAAERREAVKKSMRELQKRIRELEKSQSKYVESAKIAIREDLPDQLALARQALKATILERKRTYRMLLNAEIISQMKDMNNMTKEFVGAMAMLADEMIGVNMGGMSKMMQEVKSKMAVAVERTSELTDELEDVLADNEDAILESNSDRDALDDAVDDILFGTANVKSASSDEIDSKLKELNEQIRKL